MGKRKCVMESCTPRLNNRGDDTKSYHRFPLNPHKRKQWISATKKKNWTPSSYDTLCSDHFKKNSFLLAKDGSKLLKKEALPTIFRFQKNEKPRQVKAKTKQKETIESEDVKLLTDPSKWPKISIPIIKMKEEELELLQTPTIGEEIAEELELSPRSDRTEEMVIEESESDQQAVNGDFRIEPVENNQREKTEKIVIECAENDQLEIKEEFENDQHCINEEFATEQEDDCIQSEFNSSECNERSKVNLSEKSDEQLEVRQRVRNQLLSKKEKPRKSVRISNAKLIRETTVRRRQRKITVNGSAFQQTETRNKKESSNRKLQMKKPIEKRSLPELRKSGSVHEKQSNRVSPQKGKVETFDSIAKDLKLIDLPSSWGLQVINEKDNKTIYITEVRRVFERPKLLRTIEVSENMQVSVFFKGNKCKNLRYMPMKSVTDLISIVEHLAELHECTGSNLIVKSFAEQIPDGERKGDVWFSKKCDGLVYPKNSGQICQQCDNFRKREEENRQNAKEQKPIYAGLRDMIIDF